MMMLHTLRCVTTGINRFVAAGSDLTLFRCRVASSQFKRHLSVSLQEEQVGFLPKTNVESSLLHSIKELEKNDQYITLRWNEGRISKIHNVWLRSNCMCPQCAEASSQQRIAAYIEEVKENIEVQAIDLSHDSVTVTWDDNHVSKFDFAWLNQYCYDRDRRQQRKDLRSSKLWDAAEMEQEGLPRVSYDSIMHSDKAVWKWMKHLGSLGICIVEGMPSERDSLKPVLERISYLKNTMYGLTWNVVVELNPINVAYTNTPLPPHQDLLYYESTPGMQFLHCLQNEVDGGSNAFIDGFKVAEVLRERYPEDFDLLCRVKFTFHKFDDSNWFSHDRRLIELDENGKEVIAVHYSPPFMAPTDVDFDDVRRAFRAYRSFSSVVHDPALNFIRRQQPGEMLCFNNRRIFHSRLPFDASRGKRFMQGAYIDLDAFNSRYRVLQRQFEPSEQNQWGFIGKRRKSRRWHAEIFFTNDLLALC